MIMNRNLLKFATNHDICIISEQHMLADIHSILRDKFGLILVVKPLLGDKNGYDSFPIVSWSYDTLIQNADRNSYFVDYSHFINFISEGVAMLADDDETLLDIGIYQFDKYEQALEHGLVYFIHRLTSLNLI